LVFADAQHTVLLQNPQQFGLQNIVQFADLIEEENASFGGTNQASPISIRTSKRATPMAE
jgi:hypothetical protein